MSVTDALAKSLPTEFIDAQVHLLDMYGTLTLAGNLTLTKGYRQVLGIDPGGSGRDVTLPAEDISKGLWFLIVNKANGAETLTVKSDAPATIQAVDQDQTGLFWCDGTTWYLACLFTAPLT